MLEPLNKERAFAAIADDLELPLVLLANPDPRVQLVQLGKISVALSSTNLTFRDLAERVVALRPAVMEHVAGAPRPVRKTPGPEPEVRFDEPREAVKPHQPVSPYTVLSNEELQSFGYRSRGPGYGYEGRENPGADVLPAPTEM